MNEPIKIEIKGNFRRANCDEFPFDFFRRLGMKNYFVRSKISVRKGAQCHFLLSREYCEVHKLKLLQAAISIATKVKLR